MTEREMLELAAKAAVYKRMEYRGDVPYVSIGYPPADDWTPWNPLADDGDALRLATKLKFHTMTGDACAISGSSEDGTDVIVKFTDVGDDPYAATRLAIVRAAAAIGKQMEERDG